MNIDAIALIDILRSEKESYQGLLDLAKKEQELLVKGDAKGLPDVIKAMEHRMTIARGLEEKRLTLLKNADPKHVKSPAELSSIIKRLDKPAADAASTLREEMLTIIEDLGEVNRANIELLKRNMSHVDFMLGLITREENPLYAKDPNPRGSSPKLFDGRA